MAYIYVVTNKVNGKQYVGCTVRSLNGRWKTVLGGATHRPIKAAVQMYGFESFVCEVVEECKDEERFDKAAALIEKLNTLEPNGYNKRPKDVNNQGRDRRQEELYGPRAIRVSDSAVDRDQERSDERHPERAEEGE